MSHSVSPSLSLSGLHLRGAPPGSYTAAASRCGGGGHSRNFGVQQSYDHLGSRELCSSAHRCAVEWFVWFVCQRRRPAMNVKAPCAVVVPSARSSHADRMTANGGRADDSKGPFACLWSRHKGRNQCRAAHRVPLPQQENNDGDHLLWGRPHWQLIFHSASLKFQKAVKAERSWDVCLSSCVSLLRIISRPLVCKWDNETSHLIYQTRS